MSAAKNTMLESLAAQAQREGVVRAVRLACESQDRDGLRAILAPAVTALIAVGGAETPTTRTVEGLEDVVGVLVTTTAHSDLVITEQSVNGQSALVLRRSERVVGIVILNVAGGQVRDVWIISDPDRLRMWNRA